MRIPSMGLAEIIILAGIAGLGLLAGGLVLLVVARRRKDRTSQAAARPGPDAGTSNASKPIILLLLLGLLGMLLPLAVLILGVTFVIPIRSESSRQPEPVIVYEVSAPEQTAVPPAATPLYTPPPTVLPGAALEETTPPGPGPLSISPDDGSLFLTLPGLAAVLVLVGAAGIAVVLRSWRGRDSWPNQEGEEGDRNRSGWQIVLVVFGVLAALSFFVILALVFSHWVFVWFATIFAGCLVLMGLLLLVPRLVERRLGRESRLWNREAGDDSRIGWAGTARLRYALLGLAIWFSLSIFLILDVSFSVSVYLQFVAVYALFWVLLGLLLLIGSPMREKLLILGLFVVVLFSFRAADWNSRKPFLEDLYQIKQGMTVEQVEQIMDGYMGGICYPNHPQGLPSGDEAVGAEALAVPDRMVYRHTDEGWGNSDWGVVSLEKGRVVQTQYLPD